MADTILGSELLARLASIADAHGVKTTSIDDRTLSGTQDAITSKWFLGGRKVVYRITCQADEASRTVRFRQAVVESSWGIPPPRLTVEKTTQQGIRVSESRTDRSVGGGGHLDYAGLRAAFEQAVRAGSWQFTVEAGKMP
jgi:hypothetical protein